MNYRELIYELCAIGGASGDEWRVAEYIKQKLTLLDVPFECDKMGNVTVPLHLGNGEKRMKLMVCAHMDEVGFMINSVSKEGYLGFDTVGGISESVMAGRRVRVFAEGGELEGVIASKAIHHKEKKEREKATPVDKLYIDIGAKDSDEARALVRIGDFAVFESATYEFGDGFIKAKALDDRMSCAAMLEMIEAMAKEPPSIDADVYFCFTVREEIGLSGARVATFNIRPDVAIVLETTAVADIADVEDCRRVAKLGQGVCVSVADRSTIYDRELIDLAMRVARENNISAQIKRYVSGGNDAGSIHRTAEGVRVLALSVPTRYLHSPACVAKLCDYEAQRDLCKQIIKAI